MIRSITKLIDAIKSKPLTTEHMNQVLIDFDCKPQHPDWFPGTPTGDDIDFGYYLQPKHPIDWQDECNFQMMVDPISIMIDWC